MKKSCECCYWHMNKVADECEECKNFLLYEPDYRTLLEINKDLLNQLNEVRQVRDEYKLNCDVWKNEFEKVKEINSRLIKCVEFYAKEENWATNILIPEDQDYNIQYICYGKLARETLKEIKDHR